MFCKEAQQGAQQGILSLTAGVQVWVLRLQGIAPLFEMPSYPSKGFKATNEGRFRNVQHELESWNSTALQPQGPGKDALRSYNAVHLPGSNGQLLEVQVGNHSVMARSKPLVPCSVGIMSKARASEYTYLGS